MNDSQGSRDWQGSADMKNSSDSGIGCFGSDAIISLEDYYRQMKEGEELECRDVHDGSYWHFGRFGDELWVRGWDAYIGDYRWILYKLR